MGLPTEVSRLLESAAEAEAQGNAREARVRYEAAVKLAPDAALPQLRLGILCHRLRDYPHARQALERAARLAADDPEVAFWEGRACDAMGDRNAARTAYRRTMTLAPAGWQTWFLIAREHRQLGHADVARVAYRRALGEAPEQPEVMAELGSLLWETGKREEAFPYLEQAARACPTDAGILLQLALALAERHELLGAQDLLTDAKHLDPGDRRIDTALEQLADRRRPGRRRRKAA